MHGTIRAFAASNLKASASRTFPLPLGPAGARFSCPARITACGKLSPPGAAPVPQDTGNRGRESEDRRQAQARVCSAVVAMPGSSGREPDVLVIRSQARGQRVGAPDLLKSRRDLAVIQVGVVTAGRTDELEHAVIAALGAAAGDAGRSAPQERGFAVAGLAGGRAGRAPLASMSSHGSRRAGRLRTAGTARGKGGCPASDRRVRIARGLRLTTPAVPPSPPGSRGDVLSPRYVQPSHHAAPADLMASSHPGLANFLAVRLTAVHLRPRKECLYESQVMADRRGSGHRHPRRGQRVRGGEHQRRRDPGRRCPGRRCPGRLCAGRSARRRCTGRARPERRVRFRSAASGWRRACACRAPGCRAWPRR